MGGLQPGVAVTKPDQPNTGRIEAHYRMTTVRFGDNTGVTIDYPGTMDCDLASTAVDENSGNTGSLFAGSYLSDGALRILLSFDLEAFKAAYPSAVITAVRLIVTALSGAGTDSTLTAYPVLSPYGSSGLFVSGYGDVSEGTKNRTTAAAQNPTWNQAKNSDVSWGQAGCSLTSPGYDGTLISHYNAGVDVGTTELGHVFVESSGAWTVPFDATGISAVQTQVANDGCRLGFLLKWGIEYSSSHYVRIASSEYSSPEYRPYLEVDFYQEAVPDGIASGEAIGAAKVIKGFMLFPAGISGTESFGASAVVAGSVTVQPAGIATQQALGSITVANVVSATQWVSMGFISITQISIDSEEALGTAVLSTGPATITATGIASEESFWKVALAILPTGIVSSVALGAVVVVRNDVVLQPDGIFSELAFGFLEVEAL